MFYCCHTILQVPLHTKICTLLQYIVMKLFPNKYIKKCNIQRALKSKIFDFSTNNKGFLRLGREKNRKSNYRAQVCFKKYMFNNHDPISFKKKKTRTSILRREFWILITKI